IERVGSDLTLEGCASQRARTKLPISPSFIWRQGLACSGVQGSIASWGIERVHSARASVRRATPGEGGNRGAARRRGGPSTTPAARRLATISADTRARRINHREHRFVAACMLGGASFAKPALATAIALDADLGSRSLLASLAHDLGLLVAGQQLHLSIRRPPLPQADHPQLQF